MTNDKNPKYDLEERTAKFGENVIRFCKKIPRGPVTDPLINQLVNRETSRYASNLDTLIHYDYPHLYPRSLIFVWDLIILRI